MIGDFLRHQVFGHQARGLFVKGLKSEIRDTLGRDPKPLLEFIGEEAKLIEQLDAESIQDGPSHGHVEFCASVLAAYRVLLPIVGDKDTTRVLLGRAMMRGMNTPQIRVSLWLMLALCRGKPDRLRDIFSWLMKQYGATFSWSAPHEESKDRHSFSIEISKCFYFSFFRNTTRRF